MYGKPILLGVKGLMKRSSKEERLFGRRRNQVLHRQVGYLKQTVDLRQPSVQRLRFASLVRYLKYTIWLKRALTPVASYRTALI